MFICLISVDWVLAAVELSVQGLLTRLLIPEASVPQRWTLRWTQRLSLPVKWGPGEGPSLPLLSDTLSFPGRVLLKIPGQDSALPSPAVHSCQVVPSWLTSLALCPGTRLSGEGAPPPESCPDQLRLTCSVPGFLTHVCSQSPAGAGKVPCSVNNMPRKCSLGTESHLRAFAQAVFPPVPASQPLLTALLSQLRVTFPRGTPWVTVAEAPPHLLLLCLLLSVTQRLGSLEQESWRLLPHQEGEARTASLQWRRATRGPQASLLWDVCS